MKKKLSIIFLSFFLSFFLCFNIVEASNYKAPVDITEMSIVDLQNAMEKGYLNSELLVNLYLERIEEYDDLFNSINQLNPDALEQAKKLDEERKNGNIKGPLHGIPILVKSNIDVLNIATNAGTKALSDNYPNDNAFVIQKLVDAGAIILGSTNMSELAFSASNSYSSYGSVKNVFNTDYSSYGSSGGSAVSIGAAFAAASLGTDTNASVRIPASAAGLVGIRPTLGLVSRSGVIPYDIERDTVGVMTKTVYDNAIILNIISGEDEEDDITKDSVSYDINSFESINLSDVNIGVVSNFLLGDDKYNLKPNKLTNNSIYLLAQASIKKLENNGANIIYIDPFLTGDYALINTSTYAGITMCDNFNEYIKGTTGTIRSFQELSKSSGHIQSLNGYVAGCDHKYKDKSKRDEKKQVYIEYVESIFEKYDLDVIVYPTTKNLVTEINDSGLNAPGSYIGGVIGFPSVTVPMGFIYEFNYGMEFLGLPYTEDIIYNIASSYEIINENKVLSSNLTPNLYDIPDSVIELRNLYDDEHNFVTIKEKELMVDIYNYFINYNEIDNVEEKANELLDEYKKINKNPLVILLKNILLSISKLTLKIILILIAIIILLIIRKKIRRYFRRRKHKKNKKK